MSTLRLRGPNRRDRVDGKPKKNLLLVYASVWVDRVNQISSRLTLVMIDINNKPILYSNCGNI